MRALLRGGELDGERVLSPETVELAFTDHLQGARLPADGTHSAVPALSNDVPPLPFKQGFGLGFSLLEDIPGMRRAGTADWAGLCNTYFWIDPASGIAATLMTQVLPFFDAGVVQTLLGFEGSAYAACAVPAAGGQPRHAPAVVAAPAPAAIVTRRRAQAAAGTAPTC